MATKKKMLQAAAGSAGGASGLDITDVFSNDVWTSSGAVTRAITNGIDLATEGGLIWVKSRTNIENNTLVDTERGRFKGVASNLDLAQDTSAGDAYLTSFNTDGFNTGTDPSVGGTDTQKYLAMTFRKAPKFFDVITFQYFSGTNVYAHSLDATPGMVFIKRIDSQAQGDWWVWHKDVANNSYLKLNTSASVVTSTGWLSPSDSDFTLANNFLVNGGTYVAYLFANNNGDGGFGPNANQDIIKCGNFGGTQFPPAINLGFEPQFVMMKTYNGSDGGSRGNNWIMTNNMSGAASSKGAADGKALWANSDAAEKTDQYLNFTSNGFEWANDSTGPSYIYMAIRRGSLTPPESATEVFGMDEYTGNNVAGRLITSVSTGVVDAAFINSSAGGSRMASRLTGVPYLTRNDLAAEINSNTRFEDFDDMNGFFVGSNSQVNSSVNTYLAAMFTRAPSFFDVLAFSGNGAGSQSVPHSLGVIPEMVWAKSRSSSGNWLCATMSEFGNGENKMGLNSNSAPDITYNGVDSATSSAVNFISNANTTGTTYTAYLFATLAGISKVGSYTGDGTTGRTIDCDFTAGARYILIKRTSASGNWMEFNSEYGIIAGNEKAWIVNTGGETGSLDLVDPDNSGFIVNQETVYNLNANNSTYIFYAIS